VTQRKIDAALLDCGLAAVTSDGGKVSKKLGWRVFCFCFGQQEQKKRSCGRCVVSNGKKMVPKKSTKDADESLRL
jgi:hypothetical protein